jgi:hypothetical protein
VYAKVSKEPQRYTFTVPGDPEAEDGPAFLKAIIDHTYTNTLSNTAVARDNLASLLDYMDTLSDSNVEEFNNYVKEQLEALAYAGETTMDLISNLFKGYMRCRDKNFRIWIKGKKDAYFDRTFQINPNSLEFMELVQNYYLDAVKTREWLKPDEDQQQILALQVQLKEVKALKEKCKDRNKDQKQVKRLLQGKAKKETNKKWAWKDKAPLPGESHTRVFEGKTYYWCPNHLKWCLHKPSECNLKEEEEKGSSKPKKKVGKDRRLQVLQALMESSDECKDLEGHDEDSHGVVSSTSSQD